MTILAKIFGFFSASWASTLRSRATLAFLSKGLPALAAVAVIFILLAYDKKRMPLLSSFALGLALTLSAASLLVLVALAVIFPLYSALGNLSIVGGG